MDDHDAFGATWPAVGYYNSQTDKLNTFQIILVNRSDVGAGDFDIVLNYDQIQWETGAQAAGITAWAGRPRLPDFLPEPVSREHFFSCKARL